MLSTLITLGLEVEAGAGVLIVTDAPMGVMVVVDGDVNSGVNVLEGNGVDVGK